MPENDFRQLRGHGFGFQSGVEVGLGFSGRDALIETAKLNAVDPNAWLALTLARIPDYKIKKVDDLLPWKWRK